MDQHKLVRSGLSVMDGDLKGIKPLSSQYPSFLHEVVLESNQVWGLAPHWTS